MPLYYLKTACALCPIRVIFLSPNKLGYTLELLLMDKLEEIFRLQEELNLRIGVDTRNMSDEEQVKWVLNYVRAMQQELAELTDSVPWKWWAKYQNFDKQNARVEIIDLMHFLIS